MSSDTAPDTPGTPPPPFSLRPAAGTAVFTEIEIRRSRFLTLLRRAESEDDARSLVAEARDLYPDARHHCSAWIVAVPGAQPLQHSSDDGEPSGTAGRPMLDVLAGSGLTDVAAVVVRYFGGVLLGTGGLVRAYSDAVTQAIAQTTLVRPEELAVRAVRLPHATAARVESELRRANVDAEVLGVDYDAEGATIRVATGAPDALAAHLAATTGGEASPWDDGTLVIDRPYGGHQE